jgi:hypothetical protein
MELILIDSGLVNKFGHSYTLAKTVSGAAVGFGRPHFRLEHVTRGHDCWLQLVLQKLPA